MYVNIQVGPGRRVRHPVHSDVYMEAGHVYRVKSTARVARKLSSGDVVKATVPEPEGGDA